MADLHKSTCPVILTPCTCDQPLPERKFIADVLAGRIADPDRRDPDAGLRERVEALRDKYRADAEQERQWDGGDDYCVQDAGHAETARTLDAVAGELDAALADDGSAQ